MTYTRKQIEAIDIGTMIAHGINGRFGEYQPVVEITCRKDDIHGKLFVHGYRRFSKDARMSFSIKEGDEVDARHYRVG